MKGHGEFTQWMDVPHDEVMVKDNCRNLLTMCFIQKHLVQIRNQTKDSKRRKEEEEKKQLLLCYTMSLALGHKSIHITCNRLYNLLYFVATYSALPQ